MNKLWGMRAYLAGGIDRVDDLGAWWRNDMTPFLEEMGVVVLNPLKKPIDIGIEDSKHVAKRREFKRKNVWVLLSDDMRKLRVVDLRMCDMSDFLVVYIDPATHMCGTYEEVSWANRLKRPILCCVVGGRSNCPDWLFGMIPYQHIFDCWNDLFATGQFRRRHTTF